MTGNIIMKTITSTYKENGYEAVLIEYNPQSKETKIIQGFHSMLEAEQYIENQSLAYQQSDIYELMSIDEAIEKGF